MKKFFQTVVILAVIFLAAFSVYKFSNRYNLNILKNNIDCTIVAKGCRKAKAIAADEDSNMYVAFSDYIKSIDTEGREKIIYKNKDMNIEDIVYYNDSLIYISYDSIYKFSLNDGTNENLQTGIPLSGNGIKRQILINNDILYIAIGAMTNSGISEGEYKDLSPIDVTLNGINYGTKLTGAFKKYGVKSEDGEKIKAEAIGNASIYSLKLKDKKLLLYSSGIRGIKGFDFNSKGEIIAIFSGMDNNSLRPVERDRDYIYKVQKGVWYGWPDFSGGDSVSSPRFKSSEIIKPLIKNFISKSIPEPIYQSDFLNSLQGLAVDKTGNILEKDTILFWDSSKEKICTLSVQNVYRDIIKLKDSSHIEGIICTGKRFLVLDNEIGCVYSIHRKATALGFKMPVVIMFFIFILTVCLLIILLYKLLKKNKS